MELNNNLRTLVHERGFRRSFVEGKLEINKNTLTNWYLSRSYPNVLQLFKLCELLQCEVHDIYSVKKEKEEI